jgi:hypothetical protein
MGNRLQRQTKFYDLSIYKDGFHTTITESQSQKGIKIIRLKYSNEGTIN